jgi:hypothetical protein
MVRLIIAWVLASALAVAQEGVEKTIRDLYSAS